MSSCSLNQIPPTLMPDPWFPNTDEYGTFYGSYIQRLQGRNVLQVLEAQLLEVPRRMQSLSEPQWVHRYAEGKWSIKEVLGHITDTERIMSARALRISRGDTIPLPGFDENPYVQHAQFDRLSPFQLLDSFKTVRASTLSLRYSLADETADWWGEASGLGLTVRAQFAIIAGHTQHHLQILTARYGLGSKGQE